MFTTQQLDEIQKIKKEAEKEGEKRERQHFASLGGKARAAKLSDKERIRIAIKGAQTRLAKGDNFKKESK